MYARPVNVHCIRTSSVQATALPITQPINKFVVKRSFFNAPHTNLTVIFLKWIFFYFFFMSVGHLEFNSFNPFYSVLSNLVQLYKEYWGDLTSSVNSPKSASWFSQNLVT